jgi:hypothetical protein
MQTSSSLSLLALPLLVACGGGSALSEEDAQTAYTAMQVPMSDVQTQASSAAAKDIVVEGDGSSYTYSGEISGTGLWTGTVAVDGAGSMSGDQYSYSLTLEYIDVVVSGLTFNGSYAYDMDFNLSNYSYTYAAVGEMDVTGDASGSLDFDYTMTFDGTSFSVEGDINGYDVSTWGYGSYGY